MCLRKHAFFKARSARVKIIAKDSPSIPRLAGHPGFIENRTIRINNIYPNNIHPPGVRSNSFLNASSALKSTQCFREFLLRLGGRFRKTAPSVNFNHV
jgi:hypothetical protein